MAKSITKAEKIRNYLSRNPNATASQAAKAAGAKPPQVYAIMAKLKTDKKPAVVPPAPKLIEVPTRVGTDVAQTLKERGDKYGTFVGHATITQALKRVIYDHAKAHDKTFTDDQVEALDMICHKIGRIVNGDPNYADSWVDIAGYAKLVSDRLETGLIV
jgi:hypothetical protein